MSQSHRHTDTSPVSAAHWRKRESRLGLDFAMEGRKTGEEGERASAQPPLESPAGASSRVVGWATITIRPIYRTPTACPANSISFQCYQVGLCVSSPVLRS